MLIVVLAAANNVRVCVAHAFNKIKTDMPILLSSCSGIFNATLDISRLLLPGIIVKLACVSHLGEKDAYVMHTCFPIVHACS